MVRDPAAGVIPGLRANCGDSVRGGGPAFVHIKVFDLPSRPEKLVITAEDFVKLGKTLAPASLEQH